ncbi:MAG: hypothetical protein AB7G88_14460, partial [Thermomicrobiales bacterium]
MTESPANTNPPAEVELTGDAIPTFSPDHRHFLELVREDLSRHGFYAYVMIDDQQRWTVAVDDEAGRVDVRLEGQGYVIEGCGSSP